MEWDKCSHGVTHLAANCRECLYECEQELDHQRKRAEAWKAAAEILESFIYSEPADILGEDEEVALEAARALDSD